MASQANQSEPIDGIFSKVINNPQYFSIASIVELIILGIIIYVWKPLGIVNKYPPLANMFMLLVGFVQLMTYYFISSRNNAGINVNQASIIDLVLKIILTIVLISSSILFIYIFLYILSIFPTIWTIINYIFWIFIIILAIALIFLLVKRLFPTAFSNRNFSLLFKLIYKLIVYLPCAFIDLLEWFKKQYNITTKTTVLILAIEIILIVLKFVIPILANYLLNINGTHLLKNPIYLNNEKTIGNVGDLYNSDGDPSYNYSISFWFWINPQPPNTSRAYIKYTNILEFGRKPAVEYNSLKNILRVICQIKGIKETTLVEVPNIPLQKWNNIVINYDGGTMDVFLNGELISSKSEIAPYITMENIKVGANPGIEGGICNVVYQKKILNHKQISMAYKTMSRMNNPIVSI